MNRLDKLETMQRTERSESKAEYEALLRELTAVMTRMDSISKNQANMLDSMSRQSEIIQNALEKLNQSRQSNPNLSSPGVFPSGSRSARYESIDPAVATGLSESDQRPETVYQTAYNDYINRNYDLAILEFQGFLAAFPDSDLADNSQYWIGECYFAQQRFDTALVEFEKVLTEYPSGDKYIPALLKKGLCLIEKGDIPKGKSVLESLIDKHPYSAEARLAQDRLQNP